MSFKISSAQRTPSEIAHTVAGIIFPAIIATTSEQPKYEPQCCFRLSKYSLRQQGKLKPDEGGAAMTLAEQSFPSGFDHAGESHLLRDAG
jgi:hypothetical protein